MKLVYSKKLIYSSVLVAGIKRSQSSIYVYYAKTVLFTSFHKGSIHCTGYPLIQVEIESVRKSHYLHWLVSQSCMLTSCCSWSVWSLMDYLQCGCSCRCRYRCRCRSFCSFCCFCLFCYLCFSHVFFLFFCKIQNETQKQ